MWHREGGAKGHTGSELVEENFVKGLRQRILWPGSGATQKLEVILQMAAVISLVWKDEGLGEDWKCVAATFLARIGAVGCPWGLDNTYV